MGRYLHLLRVTGVVVNRPTVGADGIVVTAGCLLDEILVDQVFTQDVNRLSALTRLVGGDDRGGGTKGRWRDPAVLACQWGSGYENRGFEPCFVDGLAGGRTR